MAPAHIVVHSHELWLKQGNRKFFLNKLGEAMSRAVEGLGLKRNRQPRRRFVIELADAAQTKEGVERLARVSGIASLGVARVIDWRAESSRDVVKMICSAAWEEMRGEPFSTFAVRAKRSDKRFPLNIMELERGVGGFLFDELHAAGRDVRVDLKHPELTCRIEVTRGPVLLYARRIPGAGGLPPNTAGKLVCLLSGGFDSAVAAFKMMKRGAHLSFVHFWGGGGGAGESSVHVARQLLHRLVPWQFTAKLYLLPLVPMQTAT